MSGERDAVRVSYLIRQRFRYAYPGPIAHLHHRLIIAPPLHHGDQRLIGHALTVHPAADVTWSDDSYGNRVATIVIARVDDAVEFAYEARVERVASGPPHLTASPTSDPTYREASSLTFACSALRDAAARLTAEGPGGYALAERINDFVAGHMHYVAGSTSIMTTAQEAFAQSTGVCQDYAHVMVAIARACGLAARYVSGHLIGEGGTHAWVEILAPCGDPGSAIVWAFDPTHRRRTNLDYVFVAAGRDYTDVAPTSGTFVAPYIGAFTTDRSVETVDVEYAA